MADYRRYQPRRTAASSTGWGKWLVIAVIVVATVFLIKLLFGSKSTTTANANTNSTRDTNGITLVTDGENSNTSATNLNGNTNLNLNTNTTAAVTGWKNFSTSSCPKAISNFGTAKQAVLTVALSAANDAEANAITSLKTAGVPADFFVTGTFATKNSAAVQAVAEAGFPVYSQSYDSTNLSTLSDADVATAVHKAETAIVSATGVTPKPIFRPPAGSYTDATLKVLRQQGYCTVLWTVDAYDWQDGMTVVQSSDRVMTAIAKQSGGVIIALHAGYDITPDLITDLVAKLKSAGYTIVSLNTLLTS